MIIGNFSTGNIPPELYFGAIRGSKKVQGIVKHFPIDIIPLALSNLKIQDGRKSVHIQFPMDKIPPESHNGERQEPVEGVDKQHVHHKQRAQDRAAIPHKFGPTTEVLIFTLLEIFR